MTMSDRRVVQGWRGRLEQQIEDARLDLWSYGADHQGGRTSEQTIAFLSLEKVIAEGTHSPQQSEPRRARAISKEQRIEASTIYAQLRHSQLERNLAGIWRVKPEIRDLDQVKREKLAIRREDWADRKAEDPAWYSKELAYNAQRRRLKPPPSAKGEDRNAKGRAALERLKADPIAYAEFRLKRAEQCRQSRLRQKASDGVSGS